MAGSKNLPPLLDDEINRFRNKTSADVTLPSVLATVVRWGCKKKTTQTYLDYLKSIIPAKQWGKYSKRWSDDELVTLNEKDCTSFDVTFLFKLIPEVCSGIAPYGSPAYISVDETKIECLLQKAKNFRNSDAHDPSSVASSTTLDQVDEVSVKLLTVAGQLFSVKPKTLQQELGKAQRMVSNVKTATMTDKQKSLEKMRKKVCEQGKKEFETTVKKRSTQRLPFSTVDIPRSEIFHPTKLFVEREAQMPEVAVVSCLELISPLNDHVILTGNPGSGKSTVIRRLQEDFVSTNSKTFKYLDRFELLLAVECRDTSLETVPQIAKKNFPKTFKGVDDEAIVETLNGINKVIVVDGIDELNEHSTKLLEELIEHFGTGRMSTFIFASRPGAADVLMRTLRGKGIVHSIAIIQAITSEEEQIEFLKRYQVFIPGINSAELIETFKCLEEPCKTCMVQPVYLSLFCHLYHSSPETVRKWKNELAIMQQILELSGDFISERLCVEGVTDKTGRSDLTSKLLDSLRDMTVRQLLTGTLTLDQRTYRELCQHCLGDLDVSYYTILSCVLEGQSDHVNLEYYHKSFAEFLAAKAILTRLITAPPQTSLLVTIPRIIEEYTASIRNSRQVFVGVVSRAPATLGGGEPRITAREACRYDNCFRFLIMMLLDAGPDKQTLFKSCLKEVCSTLTEGRAPFSYWAELWLSCQASPDVTTEAAEAAGTVADTGRVVPECEWDVNNERYMRAATAMLPLHQPPSMFVFTPETDDTAPPALEPLLHMLGEHFSGVLGLDLGHAYRTYTHMDHLMAHLQSSTFALDGFKGSVSGEGVAWSVFRGGVERDMTLGLQPNIVVRVEEASQHQLHFMTGTRHTLDVRLPASWSASGRVRRPLPASLVRPPQLTVACSGAPDEADQVAALIEDLAPEDKQYNAVWLQQCTGSDVTLNTLVEKLSKFGLRTPHPGLPRWTNSSLNRDGSCNTCKAMSHRRGERCVVISLPERDLRDPETRLQVHTPQEVTTLTRHLEQLRPPWLDVVTLKGQHPVPDLLPLLTGVGRHLRGTLDLRLDHSYFNSVPVDDLLALLVTAECSLVDFRACLRGDSDSAWQGLLTTVARAQRAAFKPTLSIKLLEPALHQLHQLDGTPHQLVLHHRLYPPHGAGLHPVLPSTALRSLGDNPRHPLPTSSVRPPALIVDCGCPKGAEDCVDVKVTTEEAAALIKALAPGNNRYLVVHLQNWTGTDESLDIMLTILAVTKVKTQHHGSPSWSPSGINGDGDCNICDERSHGPGQRCVVLRLPGPGDSYEQ